jgi:hypothetical protein
MAVTVGEQKIAARTVAIPWYRNQRWRSRIGKGLAFAFLLFVAFLFVAYNGG